MGAPNDSGAGGFRFAYDPPAVRFGHGSVAALADELASHDVERALVVCGQTVGTTPAVIDPVTEGLGERLAGVFAETTPEKRLATAYDALDRLESTGADGLVGLGGGSSLDVAKVASLLANDDRDPSTVGRELEQTGTISVPAGGTVPLVSVPTTLAGAELSQAAGVTAAPDSGLVGASVDGGIGDPRLMPRAAVYDPALVATTPDGILRGSAMNGFDKGVETLYAADATPVTDATALRGVSILADALDDLGSAGGPPEVLDSVLRGLLLVQYGISRPGGTTLSVIHAFGHALARSYPVQQGDAHAVVAPHVLRYLFEQVDGRRAMLAEALGVADAEDPADAVVDRVRAVRDALDRPRRLRDVDGPGPEAFADVARAVLADSFLQNGPPGLDPTVEEVEAVLDAAW